MHFEKSKTKAMIAAFLVLTFAVALVVLPTANAADAIPTPTYSFIYVAPNPVGVGQTATVYFWTANPALANLFGGTLTDIQFSGITVTVTKPDGTSGTLGPYNLGTSGAGIVPYAPDQVGTYYFQMNFPAQTTTGFDFTTFTILTRAFGQSTSTKVSLTVQQQPIASYASAPLPTGYWQRPINALNREWSAIAGNWLMQGYNVLNMPLQNAPFNPYTAAPNSAHIVWTEPLQFGGIAGGISGSTSYYSGLQYEYKWSPPIIMQGHLYYNIPLSDVSKAYGAACVDLRTGKQVWWQNITLDIGQLWDYESVNQHGVIAYLWYLGTPKAFSATIGSGSEWTMYDAITGLPMLNLENASAASAITTGPHGEILAYVLDSTNNRLALWNSTTCFDNNGLITYQSAAIKASLGVYGGQWRPQPGNYDWQKGIDWNVTIPPSVPGSEMYGTFRIASGVLFRFVTAQNNTIEDIAYDANTGRQLWAINRPWHEGLTSLFRTGAAGDGVYTVFDKTTLTWTGYSLFTGQQLWVTEPYTNAFGGISTEVMGIAYGKFYAEGSDGTVYCYNLTTGKHLWTFNPGDNGFENPSSYAGLTIADGKLYVTTGGIYTPQPYGRAYKLYCIDAETGNRLWNISGEYAQSSGALAIVDGYAVTINIDDLQIYCFGKGQTATSVSTQAFAAPKGTPVLIQGTVTDQSPGQTCLGIPAKGTPAISDASMSKWMEYLYLQQPEPTNATGVPVTLTALDPNGNTQNIGTVTSDATGSYAVSWTPPVPGLYTITATFCGTNSYYSSSAETHLIVSQTAAPQASSTPPPTSAPTSPPTQTTAPSPSPQVTTTPAPAPSSAGVPTTYIVIAVVAIIIVVAVVALALRRRK